MWEIHMDWLTFSSCVALSVSLNLPVLSFLVQKRDRPFLSDKVISKTQWEGTTQGWHSVRSRLYYGKVLKSWNIKHQATKLFLKLRGKNRASAFCHLFSICSPVLQPRCLDFLSLYNSGERFNRVFPLQRWECRSLPSQQTASSLAVRVGSEEDCDIHCQLRFSFGMSTMAWFSTKLLQGGMKENKFPTIWSSRSHRTWRRWRVQRSKSWSFISWAMESRYAEEILFQDFTVVSVIKQLSLNSLS